MNVLGRIAGGMDQPALEFGPSIVFSREESAIFAKYEDRIMESLSGDGSSPMR